MAERSMAGLLQEILRRVSSVERRLIRTGSGGGGGGGSSEGNEAAGTIKMWSTDTAPANWLLCQGQAVSRTAYASLFAAIGTTYGSGDGSTTFNLPDFRGRSPIGWDGSQAEFDTLGEAFGAKNHALTAAENGPHNHFQGHATSGGSQTGLQSSAIGLAGTTQNYQTTSVSGNGTPHNNVHPVRVVNFIIKASNGDTPGDSQLTQRVSKLENVVAFHARGTTTYPKSGAVSLVLLPFLNVRVNRGGAYDSTTSRFTAPVTGLYEFTVSATSTSNTGGPEIHLFKNGVNYESSLAIGYFNDYHTFGGTVLVELEEGDFVQVYWANNNGHAATLDGTRSRFTGKLIIADP